ncbi:MAG: 30S ribosomal protein S18 [Candidatus Pacebacteria bacterium]|nr:30S ribosomal protein S18 [Candidatus Paceibacterota bacterium]
MPRKPSKAKSSKSKIPLPAEQECFFCKNKTRLDFKEMETLARFLSDRGKILPRSRSGVCAKHQRGLVLQIKRARYLSLLPYLAKVKG